MNDPGEPAEPIRVLIVEDHPMVAEGLSSLLEDYPDLAIVGSAASVADVVAMMGEISPDVAVIDFHLPDGTGADAADRIRARSPSTAIVFLSVDGSDERLLAAIEAGASSYLIKSATGKEIVHAIRSAAGGETLIPAETITGVLTRERESARQHARNAELLGRLTAREQEILALMMQGADNRTVAERLSISYATVRTHVRSILAKLGARSQLEAVAKATQWGFHAGRLSRQFTWVRSRVARRRKKMLLLKRQELSRSSPGQIEEHSQGKHYRLAAGAITPVSRRPAAASRVRRVEYRRRSSWSWARRSHQDPLHDLAAIPIQRHDLAAISIQRPVP
jgi:two-component system, NarL family, response regulator DevR